MSRTIPQIQLKDNTKFKTGWQDQITDATENAMESLIVWTEWCKQQLSFVYVFSANVAPGIVPRWHMKYGYLTHEGRVSLHYKSIVFTLAKYKQFATNEI